MKLHRRRGTRKVFYPITGDEGNRTPICALRTRRPAVERRPRLTHKDILHSIDLQLSASAPGNPLLSDARLTAPIIWTIAFCAGWCPEAYQLKLPACRPHQAHALLLKF